MPTDERIVRYNEMLADDEKVEEIGSELLKKAIRAQTEEKLNIKPTDEQAFTRVVREGQEVPHDLIQDVPQTAERLAADEWEKTWLNLGLWDRVWNQSGESVVRPQRGFDFDRPGYLDRFRMESLLTEDEMEILEDLELLER